MRSMPRKRHSFTLVELLVVIAIIGILASLIAAVAAGAISHAREARIKIELDGIAGAFKAYKQKYGSYPPNSDGDLVRHMRKLFPRSTEAFPTLSPEEAVVFWLSGFSPDPTLPVTGSGTRTPLFEFDQSRLSGGTYRPAEQTQAYAYFDTSRGATAATTSGGTGPYSASSGGLVNPDSFQVLSAGLDDDWGTLGTFPNGPHTDTAADNLASFSPRNMEDSQP